MARPPDTHSAGPQRPGSRRRCGNGAGCSSPTAARSGDNGRRRSATWLSRAGVTPAGRGGRGQHRLPLGPSSSNSASASAVKRRDSGVAPAAETPGCSAVRVAAKTTSRFHPSGRRQGDKRCANRASPQGRPRVRHPSGRRQGSEGIEGDKSMQQTRWPWNRRAQTRKNPERQRMQRQHVNQFLQHDQNQRHQLHAG